MAMDIMELRAYARTKRAVETARSSEEHPTGPMTELVYEIVNEINQRAKEVRP